jgi:hypothetical protein
MPPIAASPPVWAQWELHRHPVARARRRGKGLNGAHWGIRFQHFGIGGQRCIGGRFADDISDPRTRIGRLAAQTPIRRPG